jgi:hypothetical protein
MKAILFLTGAVGIATSALSQDEKPEIEFKGLLIIKRTSDTYHPLFLPIRARMTDAEVANARRCFEVETARMVKESTGGKVRFVPTVYVSEKPLRLFEAWRLDSAECFQEELLAEFFTLAKAGEYDGVGCYFLHYDTANGYTIPRAGYGVGGYNGTVGLGTFAVNCTPRINPLDEIFLHEWMHGLDGFFENKTGVKLPRGMLHGGREHGYTEKPWHAGDTFNGWMEWYSDYLNMQIREDNHFAGLGSAAWKHGPMRLEGPKLAANYKAAPLPVGTYPVWVYELMKGDLSHAVLDSNLIVEPLKAGDISKTSWRLDTYDHNAGSQARIVILNRRPVFAIDNPLPNDSTLNRTIDLEASQNYVFSAEVQTENVKIAQAGGRFAVNLHVDGAGFSKTLTGTKKAWTQVVFPFTTRPKAESHRLRMNVGGTGSVTSGRAYFRNVQLRKIGYPATWRFSFQKPDSGWEKPGFDDRGWSEGQGGFGTKGTPGVAVRTTWDSPDIWMRREIRVPDRVEPKRFRLWVFHDEDAEIYLDGILAAKVTGFTTAYQAIEIQAAAQVKLEPGAKVSLAVHCHQNFGGQGIDVGLIEAVEADR